MKRLAGVLLAVIFQLVFSGCAAMHFTARPDTRTATVAPTSERNYASFWEAMDNGDVGYAERAVVTGEQRQFATALKAAMEGDAKNAERTLREVMAVPLDSATKARSRELLEGVLLTQSRWQEVLELEAEDSTARDSTEDSKPLVECYAHAPAETYEFSAGPDTLPMHVSAPGMPMVEVKVNGHKKKFLIDTGAAFSVICSDFAQECGVEPERDKRVQAGTSNSKKVAILPAVADSLQVGELLIRHHPVIVINSANLRIRLLGFITLFEIDGIVGWNAIRKMNLKLDYRNQYAVIQTPHKDEVSPHNLFDVGQPTVVLTDEGGQRLNFLLDTGANETSLSQHILSKISTKHVRTRHALIGGAGGFERLKITVIPKLTLYCSGNALEFKNLGTHPDIKGSQVVHDGIIGSDLAQKGSLTIDYQNGRFELNLPAQKDR